MLDSESSATRSRSKLLRVLYCACVCTSTSAAASAVTKTIPLVGGPVAGFYAGTVELGTPPQALQVVMDTGSELLWVITDKVPSFETSFGEQSSPFYTSQSSTFNATNYSTSNHYDIGSVSGEWGYDVVSIDGLAVKQQAFLFVDETTGFNADGLMGLGLNNLLRDAGVCGEDPGAEISCAQVEAYAGNVIPQLNPQPIWTFQLNRPHPIMTSLGDWGGSLTIGGLPGGTTEADYTWVPIVEFEFHSNTTSLPIDTALPFYWSVPANVSFRFTADTESISETILNTSVTGTNGVVHSLTNALIDSGTSGLVLPREVLLDMKSVWGIDATFDEAWAYFPCPTYEDAARMMMIIEIGGESVVLDGFIDLFQSLGDGKCQANIYEGDTIFGATVFRAFEAIAFDFGNTTETRPRIGFIPKPKLTFNFEEAAASSLHPTTTALVTLGLGLWGIMGSG